ncbi:MAG: S8 family serine peptidase [Syntrophobacterales bacterium]|nr:MAG: S8 family serine peptidase [Syntrophobacterales bacterium]
MGGFVEIEIDLSAHDNMPDLLVRFRLETDSATEDDGVYIDDVEIALHVPGDAYDSFQGTSMAAPHVAGLAGLIMAAFPGISNSKVKSRILNGVDPKPGLVGMTVSGGRINAMRSLGLPIASSGLTGQAPSANQVNLTWMDNSGFPVAAWTEEDGFSVYRKTEMGGTYTLVGTAAGVPGAGNAISFTDSSASPGQLYLYLVRAYNWYGESESTNEFSVITPGGNFGSIDSNPNSACFIATAAYGSPHGRSIDLLRILRDEYLMAHPIGRGGIALYYRYSPIMAEFIADCPAMRKGVRLILSPFVAFSAVMVETTAFQKGFIFCFIVGFLLGMTLLSKGRKAEKRVSSIHTS